MRLTETDQLRLQGIPEADIIAAIQHQEIQRQSRVPVLTLSQMASPQGLCARQRFGRHNANIG